MASRRDRLAVKLDGLVLLGLLDTYQRPGGDGKWCLTMAPFVWFGGTTHQHLRTAEAELVVRAAYATARAILGGKVAERHAELHDRGGASGNSQTRRLVYALEERIEQLAKAEEVARG